MGKDIALQRNNRFALTATENHRRIGVPVRAPRLEQRINERGQTDIGQHNQEAQHKKHHNNWQQPPFLILTQKRPQFAENIALFRRLGGFFELVSGWLAHVVSLWVITGLILPARHGLASISTF
jgi:hypothetical protein